VCSWKEFAESIVREVELSTSIKGISTSDYPTLAKRPKYSVLDTGRIEKKLGIVPPTWEESLKKCIQILKNDESF
jgi:dTDP-4-dehydrorhamnose reductase